MLKKKQKEERIEELCYFRGDGNTAFKANVIPTKNDGFCVDVATKSYDPRNWLDLLEYKTIDLFMAIGPLQVLSSDFAFRKTSDNRHFLKNAIRENCRMERMFKEIV
jgi:hypothetical protein